MKIKKTALILALAAMMGLQTVYAAAQSPKGETVYVLLADTGAVRDIYVVNEYADFPGGAFTDYGDYSEVRSLSGGTLAVENAQVSGTAPQGRVYYEGTLKSKALPWNISVSHTLDAKAIDAKALAGKSGQWSMEIHIWPGVAGKAFNDQYVVQISTTIAADAVVNLEAKGGIVANAGKNRAVTFTVLPGADKTLRVSGDVRDFEMGALSFNALPFSMDIDLGDITDLSALDNMSEGFTELHDAVVTLRDGAEVVNDGTQALSKNLGKVYEGCGELQKGLSSIRSALFDLQNGGNTYAEGMSDLTRGGLRLRSGSRDVLEAINKINDGLSQAASGSAQLAANSATFSSGLMQASHGIAALASASGLPAYVGAVDDMVGQLSSLGIGGVDAILAGYQPALASGAALQTSLQTLSGSVSSLQANYALIDAAIQAMSSGGMQDITAGVKELAEQYKEFHRGLLEYYDGVIKAWGGYGQIQSGIIDIGSGADEYGDGFYEMVRGIDELYGGSIRLGAGTRKLHSGMTELESATGEVTDKTADMEEELEQKIDEVKRKMPGEELSIQSFVSPLNSNVTSVQFVMRSDPITLAAPPEPEEAQPKTTFLRRFLALFK